MIKFLRQELSPAKVFVPLLPSRYSSRGPGPLAQFAEVLDVMLEDEEVRLAVAGQPDKRLVVVFDHADHFLSVVHSDAHRRGALDQALEILRLFKGLLGRPSFSRLLWR